jgi:hypothetical protein
MDLDLWQLGIRLHRFTHHAPAHWFRDGDGDDHRVFGHEAWPFDRVAPGLPGCNLSYGGDDILAKGDDADDLQSSGGDSAILPAVGDSSVAWILEGGDLDGEGGGEGVGGLLIVKGSGCNLDAGTCDSMAD